MTARPHTGEELLRYLIAGAGNTVFTYALLVLAMQWIAYLAAYTIAYAVGIVIGYALQSRFVFRVPIAWRTAFRFPLVYVAQYASGAFVLWLLVDVARIRPHLAALVVVVATVPLGFLLSRRVLASRRRTAA
jgi:putative flippase GtrA